MTINNKYHLWQEVYLKTDVDQCKRIVTEIRVRPGSVLVYELTCGTESSYHYAEEISGEVDVVIKTRN